MKLKRVKVGYTIASNNSVENIIKSANYVTKRAGGERAVSKACMHILDNSFEPYNFN